MFPPAILALFRRDTNMRSRCCSATLSPLLIREILFESEREREREREGRKFNARRRKIPGVCCGERNDASQHRCLDTRRRCRLDAFGFLPPPHPVPPPRDPLQSALGDERDGALSRVSAPPLGSPPPSPLPRATTVDDGLSLVSRGVDATPRSRARGGSSGFSLATIRSRAADLFILYCITEQPSPERNEYRELPRLSLSFSLVAPSTGLIRRYDNCATLCNAVIITRTRTGRRVIISRRARVGRRRRRRQQQQRRKWTMTKR